MKLPRSAKAAFVLCLVLVEVVLGRLKRGFKAGPNSAVPAWFGLEAPALARLEVALAAGAGAGKEVLVLNQQRGAGVAWQPEPEVVVS